MQSSYPIISAVHVVSTPAPLGRPREARQWQLALGLTLDQVGTFWGEALVADADSSAVVLQDRLSSSLVGRPFVDPLTLIASVEALLDEPQRPLDPAVGYGLSLAIMAAEVQLQNASLAAVIADTYQLKSVGDEDKRRISLLAEVEDYAATAALFDEMIADQPAAIGYRYTSEPAPEAIGQRGEILQRFTRELQERITVLGAEGYQPCLYIALQGGYGQLAAASGALKSGPVLGYLSGLEQVARPLPVLVEDPVMLDSLAQQAAFMAQLRNFIQLRKMNLQLVSRVHANTLDNITTLVTAKAAHMLWLDGLQLGSLSRLIAAVGICRDAGVGVILGGHMGESAAAATAACHIALACQPDYLHIRPGQGTGMGFALLNRELNVFFLDS